MTKVHFGMLLVSLSCAACGDAESDEHSGHDCQTTSSPFAAKRAPDERRAYPALSCPVELVTDELGVPHIYAASQSDLFFANGYVHARDRLYPMDFARMTGQGRTSEYIGAAGLKFDVPARAAFMTATGAHVADAVVATLPEDTLALLQAYADGVNAYLEELRAGQHELPPDYSLPVFAGISAADIPEWEPRDTITFLRVAQTENADRMGAADLAMADLIQKLPPDLFHDIVRVQPIDPTVILPEWLPKPLSLELGQPMDIAAHLSEKKRLEGFDFAELLEGSPLPEPDRHARGSNNWVISGAHTASGHPLVANDPHIALNQPATFYHAHLDTRLHGSDAATASSAIGASFPGAPGLFIGHNEHVAWTMTAAFWDQTDVYVETLNPAGDAVSFEGAWVPIARYEETFVLGRGPNAAIEKRVIEYVPHHGPLLEGSKSNGKALSVKSTARLVEQDGRAAVGLLSARDTDEWMKALENVYFPTNWSAADTQGNTAYFPFARIPVRGTVPGSCKPNAPMDGTGPCEWVGFIPVAEVPQVKNRVNGYVVTANNDHVGTLQDNDPTNDPQYLTNGVDIGFRAGRITGVIEAAIASGKKLTLEDARILQADDAMPEAARVLPFLFTAAKALPDRVTDLGLGPALARLDQWKHRTPSGVAADYRTDGGPGADEIEESIAASIYFAWITRLRNAVFDDELVPKGVKFTGYLGKPRALLYLLEHPDEASTGVTLFDNVETVEVETRDGLLLETLAAALEFLASAEAFGTTDMSAWRWGELHGAELRDLLGAQTGLPLITRGPYPRGGAGYTVDAAPFGGDPKSFVSRNGAGARFVADVRPDGIVSRSSLPGGQSDDPASPHYDDLLPMWLRNESFPYYFRVEDVAAHMERYEVLNP